MLLNPAMEVWEHRQTSIFWKAASNSVASTVTATSATVPIARMHPDDQDVIDDFLLEVATRTLSLRGQFLAHVVQRAVSGTGDPNEQAVAEMVPGELLKMARAWRRDPDGVMAGLG